MKKQRGRKGEASAAPQPATAKKGWRWWHWTAVALGALLVAIEAYSGALRGPFLLDDLYLPFGHPDVERFEIGRWLSRRPMLGATFFLNYRMSGTDPYSYHVVNVAIHWATSVLVFVLLRKFLRIAGEAGATSNGIALFGAAVFLLHPVQTESVAYIASRSDVLSTFFAYAALAVFVHTRESGIRVLPALAVVGLTGCAAASKEQAVVLPVLFVLLDLLLSRGPGWKTIAGNWKLYAPLMAAGVYGVKIIVEAQRYSDTTGFRLEGLAWYEYFLTQCRVIWLYVRLIVFPYGLNVDHDIAISRNLLDHGAGLGMAALTAAAVLSWLRRKTYPLALIGLAAMLVLLAPTSSFLPIRDVAAERRMYAPLLGFLLIVVELVRRLRMTRAVKAGMAAVVCVLALATHGRASLYGSSIALWADSVKKSPSKLRPRFQLAYAYYSAGKCDDASREFGTAASLEKPSFELLVDWGHALECAGRPDEAVAKLRQAAGIRNNAHVHTALAMVLGKQGKAEEALAELEIAQKRNANFAMIYYNRGNIYAMRGEWAKAAQEYREAVRLDPSNEYARQALKNAESRLQ